MCAVQSWLGGSWHARTSKLRGFNTTGSARRAPGHTTAMPPPGPTPATPPALTLDPCASKHHHLCAVGRTGCSQRCRLALPVPRVLPGTSVACGAVGSGPGSVHAGARLAAAPGASALSVWVEHRACSGGHQWAQWVETAHGSWCMGNLEVWVTLVKGYSTGLGSSRQWLAMLEVQHGL